MVVLMDRNPSHIKKTKATNTNKTKISSNYLSVADQHEGLLVGNMHLFNGIPSRQPIQWLVPRSLFSHPAGISTCKSIKVTSTLTHTIRPCSLPSSCYGLPGPIGMCFQLSQRHTCIWPSLLNVLVTDA